MPGELLLPVVHGDKLMISTQERNDFEKFDSVSYFHIRLVTTADDKEHKIRATMIAALKEKFGHLGLTYSIGGQISFDVFPTGQPPLSSLSIKLMNQDGTRHSH
jgi:hypothetical protein